MKFSQFKRHFESLIPQDLIRVVIDAKLRFGIRILEVRFRGEDLNSEGTLDILRVQSKSRTLF